MNRNIATAIPLLFAAFACDAQIWYQANSPFGGFVLEIHETNDGTLLVGTGRGLYKSTDNGENWQSISGEYASFPVQDVESTPAGMYISEFGPYLRRSFDGGQSWETIPDQGWTSLDIVIVNDNGQIFLNTDTSVWRSSDNGDSWAQLSVDTNVSRLRTLEISPDGELFAGTYNSKIYRSSDNGDTWVELFEAAGDVRTFGFDGASVLYAGTLFSGLYRSIDNGDSWSMLPPLPGTNGVLDINVDGSGAFLAAPFDGGVLQSVDGGTTWVDITSNMFDSAVRKIFLNSSDELFVGTEAGGVLKHDGSDWTQKSQGISAIVIERFVSIDGVLYACTSSGVFISDDGGQTWQQSIRGMDDKEILALAKAPNGDLYAGGEMLYYSEDGINWTKMSQGFPDDEIYATDILIDDSGRVIVASDDYGIRITENRGLSWTTANGGLEDVTMAFIRRSGNGDLFTADGENLYRSNDLSGDWTIINDGLSDTDITEFTASNDALFAITFSDGLFKSIDNGNNWSLAIDEDLNNVTVDGSKVYGASESVISGGVYFSDDNGDSWNNIGGGLPNVQVEEVTYVQGLGLFVTVREFGLYTLDFSVKSDLIFYDGFELPLDEPD